MLQVFGQVSEPSGPSNDRGRTHLRVQPHALREHVPLLQGPLPTATSDAEHLGLMGLSERGDAAMSLVLLRYTISPLPSVQRDT